MHQQQIGMMQYISQTQIQQATMMEHMGQMQAFQKNMTKDVRLIQDTQVAPKEHVTPKGSPGHHGR